MIQPKGRSGRTRRTSSSRTCSTWSTCTACTTSSEGQTLVELVIVLAVVGLIVTGVVSIAAIAVRNARFSKDQATSARFTQESIEWIRQQRDSSWPSFYARAGRTYCMDQLYWNITNPCTNAQVIPNTIFTRSATLTSLDANSVQVDVNVGWTSARGAHESRMSTILTSWTGQ